MGVRRPGSLARDDESETKRYSDSSGWQDGLEGGENAGPGAKAGLEKGKIVLARREDKEEKGQVG